MFLYAENKDEQTRYVCHRLLNLTLFYISFTHDVIRRNLTTLSIRTVSSRLYTCVELQISIYREFNQ